ncbi:MAG: YqaA family protein [Campylobacterota bacterium]|nr:YqaA family protein [Campylobacterota bacterium]
MIYLIMFITAFASATLLPIGSEAVLLYNIEQNHNMYLLFFFAVIGNTLGGYVNYFIGLRGEEYVVQKALIKEKKIASYKNYFDKYGAVTLLFSWLPIIGDGFTLMAGVLKYNLTKFFIYLFISKFLRYLLVISIYIYYK